MTTATTTTDHDREQRASAGDPHGVNDRRSRRANRHPGQRHGTIDSKMEMVFVQMLHIPHEIDVVPCSASYVRLPTTVFFTSNVTGILRSITVHCPSETHGFAAVIYVASVPIACISVGVNETQQCCTVVL